MTDLKKAKVSLGRRGISYVGLSDEDILKLAEPFKYPRKCETEGCNHMVKSRGYHFCLWCSHSGERNGFHGKTHSDTTKQSMISSRDGIDYKENWQYCPTCGIRTYGDSGYCIEHSPCYLKGDDNPSKRPEVRAKIKKDWKKNTNRVKNILKSLKNFPNATEQKLMDIIESVLPGCYELNHPKKGMLVGNRHPDFVAIGSKKVIDMFGDYWHDPVKFPKVLSELDRVKYFEKYGYSLLVIWESELKNLETLVPKLVSFHTTEV